MNVFIISTCALPVPPTDYGGVEQVVYDEADILTQMGHNVTLAAPLGSNPPEGVDLIVTTDRLGFQENMALIHYVTNKKLLESDIIHDHSHQKLLTHAIKKSEDECFFLNTIHCVDAPIFPLMNPNLSAISKDHAENLYDNYGYTAKVVYNGINAEEYYLQREKEDYYICLGRPAPHKGTFSAIRYCVDLDVPLKVVGGMLEGQPTMYAIGIAQHCKLGSPWRYYGAVSHKKKVDLLANAKALIFPFNRETWREPFGLVVPEALACGTPVVTWNQGVFKETIIHGKTGFLADTEDEFRDYMLRVDELDPLDCANDVRDRWTRERMTEDYVNLFKLILEGERW